MEHMKTGSRMKGKTTTQIGITHVEEVPCPERIDANHNLVTVEAKDKKVLVTACIYCHTDWATLDAAINPRKKKS